MGPFWWVLNWTNFWLVLLLVWTYLAFRAGWWARGEEEISKLLRSIIPEPPDDDDPPEKVRV